MIIWYDRQGKPIKEDMNRVEKLLTDFDYKVVKQDFTPGKKYWVSTVWLGIDHSFAWDDIEKPNPHPIIFETMVFSGKKDSWYKYHDKRHYTRTTHEDMRYETETEAIAGHRRLLKKYTRKEK